MLSDFNIMTLCFQVTAKFARRLLNIFKEASPTVTKSTEVIVKAFTEVRLILAGTLLSVLRPTFTKTVEIGDRLNLVRFTVSTLL